MRKTPKHAAPFERRPRLQKTRKVIRFTEAALLAVGVYTVVHAITTTPEAE